MKPDKNFMAMFIGFIDGDGYFDIGPQKQYNKSNTAKSTIRIRLATNVNIRDLPLLEYFVKVLGVGKISNMSGNREQVRVIFSKKDLVTVIQPLIKEYNLQFLTTSRLSQFALLSNILENNIKHWEDVKLKPSVLEWSVPYLLNLDYFANWIVGFTMAEGSFGIKGNGSAFYQIKQKGIENYSIIKAISLLIAGKDPNLKAEYPDCYQLTLSSKSDVQKVVNFFSSPSLAAWAAGKYKGNVIEGECKGSTTLYGYKLIQYKRWLEGLKLSNRYKGIIISK